MSPRNLRSSASLSANRWRKKLSEGCVARQPVRHATELLRGCGAGVRRTWGRTLLRSRNDLFFRRRLLCFALRSNLVDGSLNFLVTGQVVVFHRLQVFVKLVHEWNTCIHSSRITLLLLVVVTVAVVVMVEVESAGARFNSHPRQCQAREQTAGFSKPNLSLIRWLRVIGSNIITIKINYRQARTNIRILLNALVVIPATLCHLIIANCHEIIFLVCEHKAVGTKYWSH